MIRVGGFTIVLTLFPVGTSQVWQLPEPLLSFEKPVVDWRFEDEREIWDVLALRKLLNPRARLHVPYLPFARQDKEVTNKSTFSLRCFLDVLNMAHFNRVTTVDVHNAIALKWCGALENIEPTDFHLSVCNQFHPDVIVFPDPGAADRYKYFKHLPQVIFKKVRDPLNGRILSLAVEHSTPLPHGRRFLIVDDICDGGATFLRVNEELRKLGATDIALAVTHGVFSKGDRLLKDAGIVIFTTNSLVRNSGQFEV